MAIVGNEIWVEFSGGIRSALHESKIDEIELADGENFITRDGTLQLDQRYILAVEYVSADLSAQGSGYGKFEDCEQYVTVIGGNLHQVDLTVSPLESVPVIGAGSLASGDWFFDQFESFIYAVNEIAGLARKTICDGTDGTGDWTTLHKPSKPSAAPTFSLTTSFTNGSYAGSTITDSGAGVSAALSGNDLLITTTTAGNYWVMVELDTSPDLRIDAEYRDIWTMFCLRSNTSITRPTLAVLEGTSEYDAISWGYELAGGSGETLYYRLQPIARSSRNQITHLKFYFSAPSGTNTIRIGVPFLFRVWMSLPRSYSPPPWPAQPTFQPLKYAYTHYNSTTGFESEPSPNLTISAASQRNTGQWVDLIIPATGESGVSHVRVYRVVGDVGAEAYYRLGTVANPGAGNISYTDKLALDEVELLDLLTPGLLPNDGITAIAAWQGRLCLGVGNLVEISRSDDELSFPPLSGNVDEFDTGNGLTFFCDDKKAERVLGLAAGDALTVVTDRSVRALFGTIPQNWRYVRLDCSEGAVGARAWCAYREGVILLTPSGRLLHVALGQETQDVGAKIRERIGNEGIKALATSDAVVALRADGQLEIRNQAGRYYIIDLGGIVRKGTLTHPTHSALFISGLPPRWLGTNGKLYEGGDDSFVTDGGTEGDNGIEVEGYVETRKWSIPRSYVEDVYWGASTEHVRTNGELLAPRVVIKTSRREKEYKKKVGKSTTKCSRNDSGEFVQARIIIDRFTQIPEFRIRLKQLSKAANI